MKELLSLIVTGCTADRLCDWLSSELSATYPGMFELPGGEYLSAFAECVSPKGEYHFYRVDIHGQLKQLDTGKETYVDALAWLVVRPLLEERHHLTGYAFNYADVLQGWIDELSKRLRVIFIVEEAQKDTEPIDNNRIVQSTSGGMADNVMDDLQLVFEKIASKERHIRMKNNELELSINTNIKRFEDWLERYRMRTLPFRIDLDEGKTLAVTSAPTFKHEYQGLRMHEIHAAISTPHPSSPDTEVFSFQFPVFQLELFESAENRVVVKLACKHIGLFSYYVSMLLELTKLWPETARPILNYIEQIIPEEEQRVLGAPIPGLVDATSDFISRVALNTTGVSKTGYDALSREKLEEKAARFDRMRDGKLGEGKEQASKDIPVPSERVRRFAPNRQADYEKWSLVWKIIKGWVTLGTGPGEIHIELDRKSKDRSYKGPVYSTDTIRKIIRAGRAGELETS